MHLMPISIYFDNCKRLSVTQGEGRILGVKLYDEQLRQPVDLTGLDVTFSVPSTSGQSIKRSTLPTVVDFTQAKQGDGQTIFYAAHGFVTGDTIATAANATGLPTPLMPGSVYEVNVIDSQSFTLQDVNTGNNIVLDAKIGTGQFRTTTGIVIDPSLILGQMSLTLTIGVTQQMAAMQGQDFQITLQGNGMTRIYTGRGQLDVFAQSAP